MKTTYIKDATHHQLSCTCCSSKKGKWVAQSSSYTTSFRVSNKTTNLSLLPNLSYIHTRPIIFFPTLANIYLSCKLNYMHHFCNAEIKIGWVRRFALGLKSCRIPVKNQLQNKRNLALYLATAPSIKNTEYIFALPPFEDLTSWNLQPRLSSDSEGYNSFAVHHKISLWLLCT